MNRDKTRIDEPTIERDANGKITAVRLQFGPHYFVGLDIEEGRVHCAIGATHHGIRADASEVNGEMERMVNELAEQHPDRAY